MFHSTPIIVKRNKTSKRVLSSDKTSNLSFSLVCKGNKSCSLRQEEEATFLKNQDAIINHNRYQKLQDNDDEENITTDCDSTNDQSISSSKNKILILICGDSHGRDLAWHFNKLQTTHEAFGFVKPGGCSRQVLQMVNIEKEKLTKRDTLVVISETNDVAKNEAEELFVNLSAFHAKT